MDNIDGIKMSSEKVVPRIVLNGESYASPLEVSVNLI